MVDPDPDSTDSSICLTWGHYFVNRETEGMRLFAQAIDYFQQKKKSGLIKRYMLGVASQGNFTNFAGYLVAEGDATNIDNILKEETPAQGMTHSFRELVSVARHCVFNFSVVRCDAEVSSFPDAGRPRRKHFEETGKRLKWP